MVALKAGLRGRGFDATLTVSMILRIASAVFVVLIIIVTFDFGQQSSVSSSSPPQTSPERLFKSMADQLVLEGWREAGYDTIIMDDCWLANQR